MLSGAAFNRLQAALATAGVGVLEIDPPKLAAMFDRAATKGYATLDAYILAERPDLLRSAFVEPRRPSATATTDCSNRSGSNGLAIAASAPSSAWARIAPSADRSSTGGGAGISCSCR